jgi:hypothetical protein
MEVDIDNTSLIWFCRSKWFCRIGSDLQRASGAQSRQKNKPSDSDFGVSFVGTVSIIAISGTKAKETSPPRKDARQR